MANITHATPSNAASITANGVATAGPLRWVSLIWIAAMAGAAIVAYLNGLSLKGLLPLTIAAMAPAILGLVLSPISDREWVRVTLILAWIGLAIAACLGIGFLPMALLFFCAPAMAALFRREMLIEAMVLSALSALAVYAITRWGGAVVQAMPLGGELTAWAKTTAIASTFVSLIASVFAMSGQSNAELSGGGQLGNDSRLAPRASPDAFASAGDVYDVDEDGMILGASNLAMRQIGLLPDDFGAKSVDDVFTRVNRNSDNGGALSDVIRTAVIMGHRKTLRAQLSPLDGDSSAIERDVVLMIAPKTDAGAHIFMTDISTEVAQIRQLEQGRDAAQSAADGKSLFFAGVSHELRTPLNAIIGFSDMMRSRLFGPLPGKYSEYADLIHDSGQHMLDLIGDVLDVSKIDAGKYSLDYDDFDAADVLRSSMKMIRPSADAAQVVLETKIEDGMPIMLRADRRAVRQILLNLLSNAVKFSPKGGHVIVRAEAAAAGMVVFSVKDSGSGMSAAELETIGAPYVQAESAGLIETRGSGLGLSLVKSLVDLHGGQFDIKSAKNKGTFAQVILPSEPPV
ncbi:MAG: HAMP domain-containing sensor histidine kinase [Robiginitomaculum sp.]